MNEEKTNIVPYNQVSSGGQKDYSNSNRSKMGLTGKPASGPSSTNLPSTGTTPAKSEGFFKATLKEAVDHAITTVIDPMIRNFVYSTGMSILNTLLWKGGKGSPGVNGFMGGMTPYNLISTSAIGSQQPRHQQMTQQDRVWQNYEKLHVETLDKAQAIMSRIYRIFRTRGQVKLADYYDAFNERYEFADEGWGWTSIPTDRMYAQQYADGYHVIMPKLERLL